VAHSVGYRFRVLGDELRRPSGFGFTGEPTGRPPLPDEAVSARRRVGPLEDRARTWTLTGRRHAGSRRRGCRARRSPSGSAATRGTSRRCKGGFGLALLPEAVLSPGIGPGGLFGRRAIKTRGARLWPPPSPPLSSWRLSWRFSLWHFWWPTSRADGGEAVHRCDYPGAGVCPSPPGRCGLQVRSLPWAFPAYCSPHARAILARAEKPRDPAAERRR
jgi:hypothetical protein